MQSHTGSELFTPHSASTVTEEKETPDFCFIKSDLRLVIDLQQRVKAQNNSVYARKVKLSIYSKWQKPLLMYRNVAIPQKMI